VSVPIVIPARSREIDRLHRQRLRTEKEYRMKYMVQWQVHEDKRHEALQAFSSMNSASDEPGLSDLKLIGRWHDMIGMTGVAIVETDDPKKLSMWLLNWNGTIDIEAVPVFDDEEAREMGREFLG
jgi:hypothetical protein